MNADDPKLSEILDKEKHPGFQNIAYAIRQSTVVAQYYRNQRNDRRYDVRYGLGQELARKAKYPKEFIKTLSDFLHKYNAENAQVEEREARRHGGKIPDAVRRTMRRNIQVSDIEDILALIDQYKDSELICNLLVAYGYARSSRKGQTGEPQPAEEIVEDEETDDSGLGSEE